MENNRRGRRSKTRDTSIYIHTIKLPSCFNSWNKMEDADLEQVRPGRFSLYFFLLHSKALTPTDSQSSPRAAQGAKRGSQVRRRRRRWWWKPGRTEEVSLCSGRRRLGHGIGLDVWADELCFLFSLFFFLPFADNKKVNINPMTPLGPKFRCAFKRQVPV